MSQSAVPIKQNCALPANKILAPSFSRMGCMLAAYLAYSAWPPLGLNFNKLTITIGRSSGRARKSCICPAVGSRALTAAQCDFSAAPEPAEAVADPRAIAPAVMAVSARKSRLLLGNVSSLMPFPARISIVSPSHRSLGSSTYASQHGRSTTRHAVLQLLPDERATALSTTAQATASPQSSTPLADAIALLILFGRKLTAIRALGERGLSGPPRQDRTNFGPLVEAWFLGR